MLLPKHFFKPIREINEIPSSVYKNHTVLYGLVTRVGDADGFRFLHWPVFTTRPPIHKETLSIRLAGIDAPECSHFGKKAQPYSAEAMAWLKQRILYKKVKIQIFKRDQYHRLVAMTFVKTPILFGLFHIYKNISLEMVSRGFAHVYTGYGAEYGDWKDKLINAETVARFWKRGMFKSRNLVLPNEYKKMNK